MPENLSSISIYNIMLHLASYEEENRKTPAFVRLFAQAYVDGTEEFRNLVKISAIRVINRYYK